MLGKTLKGEKFFEKSMLRVRWTKTTMQVESKWSFLDLWTGIETLTLSHIKIPQSLSHMTFMINFG